MSQFCDACLVCRRIRQTPMVDQKIFTLFRVGHKLFGQRIGIIAQGQCTADPPALPFERGPGIGDAYGDQLALKFGEYGKKV